MKYNGTQWCACEVTVTEPNRIGTGRAATSERTFKQTCSDFNCA